MIHGNIDSFVLGAVSPRDRKPNYREKGVVLKSESEDEG